MTHYTSIHLQSFQQTTGERPWRKRSSLDLAFRRKSNLPSVSNQFFFRSLLCDDLSRVTTDSCGPKLALLFFYSDGIAIRLFLGFVTNANVY